MSNFSENLAPWRPCRRIQAPQATAASKEAICKDLVPGQRTAGLKPLRQGDAVVSCRPDRLGRDTRHLLIVGKELAGGGTSLQSAKKPGGIRQRFAQLCPLSTPRRHVVNSAERCPIFGTIRSPIFCGLRDSHAGGYPVAALPSSSFTGAFSTPALRLVLSL